MGAPAQYRTVLGLVVNGQTLTLSLVSVFVSLIGLDGFGDPVPFVGAKCSLVLGNEMKFKTTLDGWKSECWSVSCKGCGGIVMSGWLFWSVSHSWSSWVWAGKNFRGM